MLPAIHSQVAPSVVDNDDAYRRAQLVIHHFRESVDFRSQLCSLDMIVEEKDDASDDDDEDQQRGMFGQKLRKQTAVTCLANLAAEENTHPFGASQADSLCRSKVEMESRVDQQQEDDWGFFAAAPDSLSSLSASRRKNPPCSRKLNSGHVKPHR